jgi:hypothetical protein
VQQPQVGGQPGIGAQQPQVNQGGQSK